MRGIISTIIVGLVVSLAPLASADPPDPIWIAGIWDGDDADAAVPLVDTEVSLNRGAPVLLPHRPSRVGAPKDFSAGSACDIILQFENRAPPDV
jgi:hypothetical protein